MIEGYRENQEHECREDNKSKLIPIAVIYVKAIWQWLDPLLPSHSIEHEMGKGYNCEFVDKISPLMIEGYRENQEHEYEEDNKSKLIPINCGNISLAREVESKGSNILQESNVLLSIKHHASLSQTSNDLLNGA